MRKRCGSDRRKEDRYYGIKENTKALEGNSAIRAMFNEGREMAAKYGEENVFDFSLGNPATPAPKALNDAIRDLLDEADAKGAAGSLGIMVIWQMRAMRKYARRSQRI